MHINDAYNLSRQYFNRRVMIRTKDGRIYRGRIVNLDRDYVYLIDDGYRNKKKKENSRQFFPYGFGVSPYGYGVSPFGVALGSIATMALDEGF